MSRRTHEIKEEGMNCCTYNLVCESKEYCRGILRGLRTLGLETREEHTCSVIANELVWKILAYHECI